MVNRPRLEGITGPVTGALVGGAEERGRSNAQTHGSDVRPTSKASSASVRVSIARRRSISNNEQQSRRAKYGRIILNNYRFGAIIYFVYFGICIVQFGIEYGTLRHVFQSLWISGLVAVVMNKWLEEVLPDWLQIENLFKLTVFLLATDPLVVKIYQKGEKHYSELCHKVSSMNAVTTTAKIAGLLLLVFRFPHWIDKVLNDAVLPVFQTVEGLMTRLLKLPLQILDVVGDIVDIRILLAPLYFKSAFKAALIACLFSATIVRSGIRMFSLVSKFFYYSSLAHFYLMYLFAVWYVVPVVSVSVFITRRIEKKRKERQQRRRELRESFLHHGLIPDDVEGPDQENEGENYISEKET